MVFLAPRDSLDAVLEWSSRRKQFDNLQATGKNTLQMPYYEEMCKVHSI